MLIENIPIDLLELARHLKSLHIGVKARGGRPFLRLYFAKSSKWPWVSHEDLRKQKEHASEFNQMVNECWEMPFERKKYGKCL